MWSTLVLLSVIGFVLAGPPVSRSREDIESFKNFLERSRRDDGIRLESRMLANPKASVWENSGKFQGDILLNDEQAEILLQQYSEGRNAYIWPNTKWPSDTVVYEFSNEFNNVQIHAIFSAMREISDRTCIRFRRRTGSDFNYVKITGNSDGCYASVGYWETFGAHTLNLALDTSGRGCFKPTVIIHEWLHVIGFFHMQSTHNRDEFVHINRQNISPGMEHNFVMYGTNIVDNLGLPYEYASTMHYGRYAFSNNGQPTMLPIFDDDGLMGQQMYVTSWDWMRANKHYNCPDYWSAVINAEELPKGSSNKYQYQPEQDTVVENIQEDIVDDLPQEDVLVEDMAQKEVVADEVSFVDVASQDLYE